MARFEASFSDLSEIINVYPEDCLCVGWATSKGRRCHNRINAANRADASSLLYEGTNYLQQGRRIDDILQDLAPLVLCKGVHQSKAVEFTEKWICQVDKFQRRQRAALLSPPHTSRVSTRSSPRRRVRTEVEHPYTRPSTSYEASGSPSHSSSSRVSRRPPTDMDYASMTTVLSQQNDQLIILSRALETLLEEALEIRSHGRSRSSDSTEAPAATRESTESVSMIHSNERISASVSSPSETLPSSDQVRIPDTPEIPTTSDAVVRQSGGGGGRRSRIRRRPIEGDCAICMEPLLREPEDDNHSARGPSNEGGANDNSGDRLTWCKYLCGKNYHESCIDKWIVNCRGRQPTCPNCRANWRR